MAASADFSTWLKKKLRELNTDENVFGSYIVGILEDDDTPEEKRDALEGILGEILHEDIDEVIQAILDKWSECIPKEDAKNKGTKLNVDEQLVKLLESTKVQTVVKERQYTEEEKKIRDQILAQYSQTEVSEDEFETAQSDDETDKHGGGGGTGGLTGISRNTNALDVQNLQKEKREQSRVDAAAKKQKDKEDREKQKQLREEKKEKRKTVKGERKR